MGSYAYSKVDIEGVGCFTVAKPVRDLLVEIGAERDYLREELAARRAIAQNALDHGGDKELVYAPLYQKALEDIASEEQDG